MEFERTALKIGDEVERELRASRRNPLSFLFPKRGASDARVIYAVRDLYSYPRVSAWVFDFSMRTALNFGNWTISVGVAVNRGYLAFQSSRDKFRAEARLRPPTHVSETRARRDLEVALAEKRVVWREQ